MAAKQREPGPATMREYAFLGAVNALVYLRYPRQVRKFRKRVGYYPNVACPARYHEKMLWRKVFDRNPAFFVFCDKLASKQYYRDQFPGVPIVEPLWSGTRLDDQARALVDAGNILKANHGSGFIVFPEDHAREPALSEKRAAKWMERSYGGGKLEPAYRKARKGLLVEPRVGAGLEETVFDIYIRACMGEIAIVSILSNVKRTGARYGYFDQHGNRLRNVEPKRSDLTLPDDFEIPSRFAEAVAIARQVSSDFDYVRVDFLACGNQLFANEITIYPNAGLTRAQTGSENDLNEITSATWDLRNSHFMRNRQPFPLETYRRILLGQLGR